ncbi:MAG: hypothetical protein H7A33_07155 [Deltaproteobacteria bacterium]|nr:hypothetical protein [Deltaproteobacteria bacterium]
MITKIYKAKTYSEAIAAIKSEMGASAKIISTQKIAASKGLFSRKPGGVEVQASVDERQLTQEQIERIHSAGAPVKKQSGIKGLFKAKAPEPAKPDNDLFERLEQLERVKARLQRDNESLRKRVDALGSLSASAEPQNEWDKIKPVLNVLKNQKMPVELYDEYHEQLNALPQNSTQEEILDQFFGMVSQNLKFSQSALPERFALVGPSGAGKTVTAIKLVSLLREQKKKVMLVSLDGHVSHCEFLRICAEELGVTFHVVHQTRGINNLLPELKGYDHVVIDTESVSGLKEDALSQLRAKIDKLNAESILVLESDRMSQADVLNGYKTLGLHSVIFTKLDESKTIGPMLAESKQLNTPVSYFGIGNAVGQDLEKATPERVLGFLIPGPQDQVAAAQSQAESGKLHSDDDAQKFKPLVI